MSHLSAAVRWDWRWCLLVALACVCYVGFALSPSSYAAGLEMLGQPVTGTILGSARGIRSDEWMVLTPYMQIAVENDFATANSISPYQESLRTFQALPLRDWALLFKPYHWGFLVAPPAYGYSFYFFFLAAAFIVGWALFVRKLGLSVWVSVPIAVALYFSQYVQAWWTTNAGAFALAPWVALAWMYSGNRLARIGLTAYAILVWLLSCAYPPFLYSIALAIGFLILGFRRDAIRVGTLFDATVAGSIALALFIGYFHELIDVMQQTVYPGRRIAASGGVGLERLLGHFAPTALINGYEPLPRFTNSNACEIAVLSTLLPLFAVCLADHRRFRAWMQDHRWSIFAILVGLGVFAAWMFLSVNPLIARVSGLYLVPPARALVGFGLLVNILAAAYLAIAGVRVSTVRALLLAGAAAGAVAVKYLLGDGSISGTFSRLDLVPLAAVVVVLGGMAIVHSANARTVLVCWVAAGANLAMFGLFNPVQVAHPIFNLDRELVRSTLLERGAVLDERGTLVAPGHYGALIAGAGISSINHVLYAPQLDFFRGYFGDMEPARFNEIFNRYAHVSVIEGSEPVLMTADSVGVPFDVMAGRMERALTPKPEPEQVALMSERPDVAADLANGHIDDMIIDQHGRFRLAGWSRTPPGAQSMIGLWSNAGMQDVLVKRVPRPDVAAAVSTALAHSGFIVEGFLEDPSADTELCVVGLASGAVDTTMVFPDGSRTCTHLGMLDKGESP